MKDNKSIKNKRIIALALALGVLVFSLLGSNLAQRRVIDTMEDTDRLAGLFDEYFGQAMSQEVIREGDPGSRIMVVPIHGTIGIDGSRLTGKETYNHDLILSSLDQAMEDESIIGVMLEINSPGGAVYHSAEINSKIKDLKEARDIPVYASMGMYAASGGYYVAAPADKIYASNDTITGSIGVISTYYNYQELAEKIGIRDMTFKSAPLKDIGSGMRDMTEEEAAIIQAEIDEFFNEFINVVEDGRGHILSRDEILNLATGRTYTGRQAVQNGLVDEIGYFDESLDALIAETGVESPEVFSLAAPGSQFTSLFGFSAKPGSVSELDLIKYLEETGLSRRGYYYIHGGY